MKPLATLGVRQLSADRSVPLVLALVILVLSLLGTAAPRLLRAAEDAQVPHEIAHYPGILSQVAVATGSTSPFTMEVPEGAPASELAGDSRLWAALDSGLRALREGQPEPFRSMLGEPIFHTITGQSGGVPATPGSDLRGISLALHVSPLLEDHARLVEGEWPAPMPEHEFYRGQGVWDLEGFSNVMGFSEHEFPPAEIAISQAASERTGWEVGETRPDPFYGPLTLVGTFEAIEAESEFWYRMPSGPEPFIIDNPNAGLTADVGAYLNPMWSDHTPGIDAPRTGLTRTAMWFPITGTPPAVDLELTRAQAAAFIASPQTLGESWTGEVRVRFDSPLTSLLDATQDRIGISGTLIALLAVGPAVVGAAVLVLGTRLVVDRRRTALQQLASRGGSVRQLAGSAAVEAAAIALPAAALGVAGGLALVRVPFSPVDAVAALVLVLATVALLTLTTRGVVRGLGISERRDLTRRAGRTRRIVEATVVVLSLAILALAAQRAFAPPEVGEDPAAAEAAGSGGLALLPPVALMALAVVVVLRLYPRIVRWAERRAHAGRGAVPFVALARSTRTPAGGLVPVVALVVGVSVGLFSAILTSTVDRGSAAAQWEVVGADIRFAGPMVTPELREALLAVDGVEQVSRLGTLSATDFPASPRSGQNSVWYVDAAALVAAQRDAVDQPRVPAALAEVGERIPAVASPGLGVEVGDTSMTLNGRGVEVVAVLESVAGVRQTVEGLVVDAAALPEGPIWVPRAALIDVAPGADAAAVAEEVRAVAGSGVATVREGYGLGFDGSPLGDAMRATQIGAVAIAAAFVGLVLVLTQMLDAPRRARVVAVMRTVGLRRGQAAQLAAWELAPTVVVSVVAGALVGLLVPWMVAATTDLTPLTGGEREPVLALDPGVVGGVLGVIVLVAVAAVAISAWVAGRASIGTELREVGE